MPLYTWGLRVYSLKKGTTRADLVGHYPHLQIGDVLIFEEVTNTETGRREHAERFRRHAVRLTNRIDAVQITGKPVFGTLIAVLNLENPHIE